MKNYKSTRWETITELTEGTEGDNQLEKHQRQRRDLPCLCPLWVIQFLQDFQWKVAREPVRLFDAYESG